MAHLFSELDVAGVRLANRIVLPPMATEQADVDGHPSPATAGHYGSLAATGVALVVVEHSCVAPEGRASPGQMSLASDAHIAGHVAITAAIHAAGSLCAAQISHAGSNRWEEMPGGCLGPSAIEHPVSHRMPEEMSGSDIVAVIRAFGAAAGRVREAGYDFVEVHCAHGYLLGEFLSPLTNHRTDSTAGQRQSEGASCSRSSKKSGRPCLRICRSWVRLGVADNPPLLQLYEGGLTMAEGVEAARALGDAGVAILDLSAGICGSRPAGITGEAYFSLRLYVQVTTVHGWGLAI